MFEYCVNEVLKHEGGYVYDSNDPGGETKFGISKKAYPNLNIKDLTIDDAKKIYKRDYWDKLRLGNIKYEPLACAIFDTAINMGTTTSIRFLQQALSMFYPNIIIDGIIGPQTIKYLNICNFLDVILKLFTHYRIQKYIDIANKNLSLKKYLKGWIRRV